MRLFLPSDDLRYAAEQILMSLFPEEKPEYSGTGEGNSAKITLSQGEKYLTCTALIARGERTGRGSARVSCHKLTDDLRRGSLTSMIIKLAFYRAARPLLDRKPAWGALTGIRPGVIFTSLLEKGMSPRAAMGHMERVYYADRERIEMLSHTSRASLEVRAALGRRDIGVYVGIPFCPTRCAYCSFVSLGVEKSRKLIEPFLDALYREIDRVGEIIRELGLRPVAVYIGGGTPTTLSAEQLTELIERLRAAFSFRAVSEFCVEAGRPDTITEAKLRALRAGGVTRVSVNPQSLSPEVLEAIGRSHTAGDFRRAYAMTEAVFGGDINTDLIAGLPADTPESFGETLREIVALGPANITVHTLALKKGTRITLDNVPRPGTREVDAMLTLARQVLTAAGYRPYYLYRQKFMSGGFENVGWAKPGKESLYNILIMEELCTILAAGGGASTKLVNAETGRIERIFDYKYPKEYIEGIEKTLADKEKIKEFYETYER
ncbi:MAG: coproporphyrinogen dehydrogenase HemZ [Oscillospiraceae bacterium]|nr:coproporphyrinogen dehydrogenase HemZ [Oscillospiraceae bacterium]